MSIDKEAILSSLTDEQRRAVEAVIEAEKAQWAASLAPKPNGYGLCRLPRDPRDENQFLPTFRTDGHTYHIIGGDGIGIERYTEFQKFSVQRGFARSFADINKELERLRLFIGGERDVAKLVNESILSLSALQDGIASFSREQYDASLWLATLFVLRDGEDVKTYSEQLGREKIEDWKAYGYSEVDFFFLTGQQVGGYGSAFREAVQRNEKARERLLAALLTDGSEPRPGQK